jgi:2-polyprenyl-3-methyl-5-hydroxy-6-metoxy-1,4-benzoquinol methylase
MLLCPFCKTENTNVAYKDYYSYDLVYCSTCDIEFMHPYKAPGAEFYETSEDELSAIRHVKLEAWPNNHPSSQSEIFKQANLDVLDIGCSNGAFAEFITNKKSNIIGMDFDSNSLELAKTRHLPNAEFIVGDLTNLKKLYPNKQFDVISMFMVLEHIENPMETVNHIYNLLKPGGFFIGTIPNEQRYFAKTFNLKSALPPLHLNYWNINSFTNHIKKFTGFKINTINNEAHYGYVAYVWKIKNINRFKNPLYRFCIRGLFTIFSVAETLFEKISKNGSGTYFELKK